MKIDKKYKLLRKIIAITDGKVWIQGSFLDGVLNHDIDIMVEPEVWYIVAPFITLYDNIEITTYGGFKIKADDTIYDIWCDTIERSTRVGKLFSKAYNPVTGIIVMKEA